MNKLYPILEYTLGECKVLDEVIVDEKTNDKTMRVSVVWQMADKLNINGRFYPRAVLEQNIEDVNSRISENKTVYGSSFHPSDGIGDAHDVTHIWESVNIEKDGTCTGILKVLPTSKGKEIQVILKEGGYIGLSSRGFGTTTKIEKEIDGKKITYFQINKDFKLQSPGDFVLAPSVTEAGVRAVLESLSKIESQLKQTEDSNDLEEGTMIKSIEELKKEHPEFVEQIEKEAKAENKTALTEKDTEIETLKTTATEKDTEIEELKAEVAKKEAFIEKLGKDILTELPEAEEEVEEEDENKEATKMKTENEDLKTKVADFEKKESDRVEVEKKEKADVELQEKLKTKVDETLKDEKYTVYEALIRGKITVDEKITIEAVDKVEDEIEKVHKEISDIAVKTRKADLGESVLDEQGKVKSPEGEKKSTSEEKLIAQYDEAVASGFKGDFKAWKEIFVEKE